MVEVFKTNVQLSAQATKLLQVLSKEFPPFRINFDLEDCDKILRVEGSGVSPEEIIGIMNMNGYHCQVLE